MKRFVVSASALRKILLVLFFIMIALDGYQVYRIAFVRHEADFPADLAGAQGLRFGTNPYLPTGVMPFNTIENYRPYIYPLFIAWLWIPMTFLSPLVISFLWYFLNIVMMLFSLKICMELIGVFDRDEKYLICGIIVALFVSVLQWVFMFGHFDMFALLLLMLAAKYLVKNEGRSGFFLGAAISAKLMPIVVLPMLIKNGVKSIAIAFITIFVSCIVIPYLIAGSAIFHYYSYWFNETIGHEMLNGDTSVHSFALAGAMGQLLGMDRPTLILKLLCGLFLISFPIFLILKGKTVPAFFISCILIPLTSTRSEPNHLIMLIPAMMLLASTLMRRKNVWRRKEITLTPQQTGIGWILLVLIQLMILWGYNASIPLDTIGMMMVFGLVFWIGYIGSDAKFEVSQTTTE